jgi:hypothetical protein
MMKNKIPALLLMATLTTAIAPQAANAYYTRQDVLKCNDQAAGNTIFAAVLGGVAGALLGNQSGNAAAGAAIGAAAGGALGLGLNCREQTVYVENVDRYLDDDRYDEPYNWDGGSVIVTRTMSRNDGIMCREYQSTIRTPRGMVTKTEVACRESGRWVHGYDARNFRVVRDYRVNRRPIHRPMPPRGRRHR